jgi:RNA polymerase sigma-70 factor (family 1)
MREEKRIATSVSSGEEIDFEKIFKLHYSKLIFFANKFVNDVDTAEELVSETFACLWEKRHKYSFDNSFSGFLYKMVQNRCLNYLKHKKVESEYVNYLSKNNLLNEATAFEEEKYAAKEFETYILEAIDNLPARCREVFKLSRFEQKKNREIASLLNISNKTVERQMTIALEKLRFRLQHFLVLILFFL